MGVCDAHGAVHKSQKNMSIGEGYLLAARFMQRSIIQDLLLDRDKYMMETMDWAREQFRLQYESIQGAGPWLICEACIDVLKLGQDDKNAAREAARRWWQDKTLPGHMPGEQATTKEKKPALFIIYGNGFAPSEEQAKHIMVMWLLKRKDVLGEDAVIGVRSDLRKQQATSRVKFINVVTEAENSYPGQATDDILMLDQKTGKDMALIAVWAPEDTNYIRKLLNSKKEWIDKERMPRWWVRMPDWAWTAIGSIIVVVMALVMLGVATP